MRNCFPLCIAAALLSSCTLSPSGTMLSSLQGEQLSIDNGMFRDQFWPDDTVRVTCADSSEIPKLIILSVVNTPAAVHRKRQETVQSVTMAGPRTKMKIDKETGSVSFLDLADNMLLRESAGGRKKA
jgi:hypothetical protein